VTRTVVAEQVPERPDHGHVCGSQQSVRLDEHSHLAAVAARIVGHPAEVQDSVHGLVGDLRRPPVVGQVERREWQRGEVGAWGIAQVPRQPVAEAWGTRESRPALGRSQPSSSPTLHRIANSVQTAEELWDGSSPTLHRIANSVQTAEELWDGSPAAKPHQKREVVGAARRCQRPNVLEPEVAGGLVDPVPGS
jgi:hypothetical protein